MTENSQLVPYQVRIPLTWRTEAQRRSKSIDCPVTLVAFMRMQFDRYINESDSVLKAEVADYLRKTQKRRKR